MNPGQRRASEGRSEALAESLGGDVVGTTIPQLRWPDLCRRIAREAWERRNRRQYVEFARCCPGQYAPLSHERCCP